MNRHGSYLDADPGLWPQIDWQTLVLVRTSVNPDDGRSRQCAPHSSSWLAGRCGASERTRHADSLIVLACKVVVLPLPDSTSTMPRQSPSSSGACATVKLSQLIASVVGTISS